MQELTELLPYLTAEDRQALLKYVRSLAARHPRAIQAREARARYIAAAVAQAQYEVLPDDGSIYATIPGLQGVWAQGKTRESTQAELAGVLEGWLTLSLERRRPIPVIGGIDLNLPS
jgi:predicted RNase H-like HicB family nuclease